MAADDNLCGLFGGTFDPIHRGHIAPIREVLRAAALAQVAYIPAAVPPHRPQPEASANHRLEMTRIALADEPHLTVDDIELNRRGPSYTIDTLERLRRRHPRRRYVLIVGLDALLGLETWHRWQTLQQSVHIIAVGRPDWRLPSPLPRWWRRARVESISDLRRAPAGRIIFIETAPVALSATLVRQRIAAGEDVGELLPTGVWRYIRENKLYGS